MENKEFEKYLNNIEFDDKPDHAHRDKLEQKLLVSLTKKETDTKVRFFNKIYKIAAAAVIIIGVFIGITNLNGTNAWAQVIRAFNKVENVHMTQTLNMQDGSIDKHEIWIRMPDCLYEDRENFTFIDNGIERLTLDRENRTAQFSDSFMPYKSVAEHSVFDSILIFQNKNQDKVKFTKIEELSTETMLVFDLKFIGELQDFGIQAKAWVDARTMLPLKIQAKMSEPKADNPVSGEVICDYNSIPDSAFAMAIPSGFTELPRKQKGVLSGTVLDENGSPVANAIVFATDRAGQFSKKTLTDKSGNFIYNLPPDGIGTPVWLPIMFRAYEVNVSDKVAWSIIKDPKSKEDPGGNIPYEVASIENDGTILRSANGITLRMEPAGMIAGHIKDKDDNPVSDAEVKIQYCQLADINGNAGMTGIDIHSWNGRVEEEGAVRTDKDGRYVINNLPKFWKRTKVFVQAKADGYAADSSYFYADGPIEYKELDFQLYKSMITVNGILTNNFGEPIAESPISAIVNDKQYLRHSVKTDEKGRFTIKGCPDTPELQIEAELSHNFMPPHEKEKYESYEYYPDVLESIDYQENRKVYEIQMTVKKPDITLNLEVRNTAGELLKYFPVEIHSKPPQISSEWKIDKKFERRTDENGRCTFTEVPEIKGLILILDSGAHINNEQLSDKEKEYADENKNKYSWTQVPVELHEGQKKYNISVIALTRQEHNNLGN